MKEMLFFPFSRKLSWGGSSLRPIFVKCQPVKHRPVKHQLVKCQSGKRQGWTVWVGLLTLAWNSVAIAPLRAAEKVHATYSFISLDLDVSELEQYAMEGANSALAKEYDQVLKPAELERIRQALQASIPISAKVMSRFLSTASGDQVLDKMTRILRAHSESVDSGPALRQALELAAADEQGLTLLGLIRHYPDAVVEIDALEGLKVFEALQRVSQENQTAINAIKAQSRQRSQTATVAPESLLQSFEAQGALEWTQRTLTLQDSTPKRLKYSGKARTFPVDLYVPVQARLSPAPVIIISHGLGLSRAAYTYFAEHLVSHGYVVAIPEHPGSSTQKWRSLLNGETREISNPNEFIDRPLDIQFLLDELTRFNQTEPSLKGRLNLNAVGMMGHSFGGYTALSIAGGRLDQAHLAQACQQDIVESLNPSLLLQCQAQNLPPQLPDLSDPRVKAVILTHPIASVLFGQIGLAPIQIPIMMFSGGQDIVALPISEQIRPFSMLASRKKYFVFMEGASHFSSIGDLAPEDQVFDVAIGGTGDSDLYAHDALKVLGLSFFDAHLHQTGTDFDQLLYPLSLALNNPAFPLFSLDSMVQDEIGLRSPPAVHPNSFTFNHADQK